MRVLIEFDNALGDVVTELPILHALQAVLPPLSVEVVVKPHIAGLLEDYSCIIRVHGREKSLRSRVSPITSSWREPFDYYLYLRSHPAVNLSRILVRARTKIGAEGFDPSLSEVSAVHHRYSILQRMPFAVPELRTAVELEPRRVQEARELAGIDDRARVVCVGPGAIVAHRQWPKESFSRLLRELEGQFDAMLLIGSPEERDLCEEVATGTPAKNLAGGMSLTQLAALLSQAALYIGNDSGLSHLAAAQGCKAVSIGLQSEYYFPWQGFAIRGPCNEISSGDVMSFLHEMSLVS